MKGPPPKIVYPCIWTYSVIGSDEEEIRRGIAHAVGIRPHVLKLSQRGQSGKYCALHLDILVQDEADRNTLFDSLKKEAGVKFVL